jgi:ABC-2 type transport system ATP-binding protein
MPTAIHTAELVKTYPGDVRALDGLGFDVEAGSIFGLLGPNGAGKSTTVKILTTLTRPDAGEAAVAGIDVLADPGHVRKAIGAVGQKPGFDPAATGRENLMLRGELYDVTGDELRGRVDELLGRFDLDDAADRAAGTYSGGMQRRLDVALGLVQSPQVLFLDEPTTGLDPEVRAEMWAEIRRLSREQAMTILLTTHYLEEADELADRLAIVDRGKVVAEGTSDELKSALHGDSIEIELASAADGRVRAAVQRVVGVTEVDVETRILRALARDGATAMPGVLAALQAAGQPIARVSMSRPSLDEVYLRHAGRAFREADTELKGAA